jgi:hypothetical protein
VRIFYTHSPFIRILWSAALRPMQSERHWYVFLVGHRFAVCMQVARCRDRPQGIYGWRPLLSRDMFMWLTFLRQELFFLCCSLQVRGSFSRTVWLYTRHSTALDLPGPGLHLLTPLSTVPLCHYANRPTLAPGTYAPGIRTVGASRVRVTL